MWRKSISLFAMICCYFGGECFLQGQQGRDIWQQLKQDWEARRRWASLVEYRLEGERTDCAGSQGEGQPTEDVTHPIKIRWILDFSQGRMRKEMDWAPPAHEDHTRLTFLPTYHIMVYDGKDFAEAYPREKNKDRGPDITYMSAENPIVIWTCDLPIFYGHGYVPSERQWFAPYQLTIPLPRREEWVIIGQRPWKGQQCWILRTGTSQSNSEYWINMRQQSAVVRCVSYSRGKIWEQLDIDYQQTRWGWLPAAWTYSDPNFDNTKIRSIMTLRVAEFAFDPTVTSKDFQPPLEPGRLVQKPINTKGTYPDYLTYIVGSDGKLHLYYPESRKSSWWPLFFLAMAILLGLGLVLWFRQRARRQV